MFQISKNLKTITDSQKLTEIHRIVEETLSNGFNHRKALTDINTIFLNDGFFSKLHKRLTDKLTQKRLLMLDRYYDEYNY
jgi:hypothetical protein